MTLAHGKGVLSLATDTALTGAIQIYDNGQESVLTYMSKALTSPDWSFQAQVERDAVLPRGGAGFGFVSRDIGGVLHDLLATHWGS